jgi:hypothetical protein
LSFTLGACGGSGGGTGAFGIALMDGMQDNLGEMSQAVQVNDASFDLGDLRATADFFFLLYNTSDETITNVALTSDSAAFQVKPASMEALAPQNGVGVLPIVRVSAVHGLDVSGIGIDDLMPKGTNEADITVSGTSAEGEDSLVVHLAVDAKVMDISLFNGGQEVDLLSHSGARSSTKGGLGFIRRYLNMTDPSITNTGNVSINVTYYRDDEDVIAQQVLEPGNSMDINMPAGDVVSLVELDSKTVCDPDRFLMGNDGKAYFFLDPGSM